MSHLYTIDIFEEFSKFRHYHNLFANPQIAEQLQQEYLHMVVEQMIAHFEVETTAVQMFVGHYTQLITDSSVSPLFKYHPLKFLRQMTNEEYQHYIYCLYGFAEEMLRVFQRHRLYTSRGTLLASYQRIENDVLYLIVRPEVSDVFLLQ